MFQHQPARLVPCSVQSIYPVIRQRDVEPLRCFRTRKIVEELKLGGGPKAATSHARQTPLGIMVAPPLSSENNYRDALNSTKSHRYIDLSFCHPSRLAFSGLASAPLLFLLPSIHPHLPPSSGSNPLSPV